jgi:hypothetical protein
VDVDLHEILQLLIGGKMQVGKKSIRHDLLARLRLARITFRR